MSQVFSPSREKAGTETFKAGASEILQIFPLVREFIVRIVEPTGELEKERESVLGLFGVLDCMLVAKKAL